MANPRSVPTLTLLFSTVVMADPAAPSGPACETKGLAFFKGERIEACLPKASAYFIECAIQLGANRTLIETEIANATDESGGGSIKGAGAVRIVPVEVSISAQGKVTKAFSTKRKELLGPDALGTCERMANQMNPPQPTAQQTKKVVAPPACPPVKDLFRADDEPVSKACFHQRREEVLGLPPSLAANSDALQLYARRSSAMDSAEKAAEQYAEARTKCQGRKEDACQELRDARFRYSETMKNVRKAYDGAGGLSPL